MSLIRRVAAATLSVLCVAGAAGAQAPSPRPFPQPGPAQPPPSQPTRPSAPPAASPADAPPPNSAPTVVDPSAEEAPTQDMLGVPIYPGAQFIASYDAGRGQRYYLFGSTAAFVDLVNFYRNVLKQRGQLVYDVPATHEFDVGRFREETMAFPPGVTIKDFESNLSKGYPNPRPAADPERFPSIIQIVPVVPER